MLDQISSSPAVQVTVVVCATLLMATAMGYAAKALAALALKRAVTRGLKAVGK